MGFVVAGYRKGTCVVETLRRLAGFWLPAERLKDFRGLVSAARPPGGTKQKVPETGKPYKN